MCSSLSYWHHMRLFVSFCKRCVLCGHILIFFSRSVSDLLKLPLPDLYICGNYWSSWTVYVHPTGSGKKMYQIWSRQMCFCLKRAVFLRKITQWAIVWFQSFICEDVCPQEHFFRMDIFPGWEFYPYEQFDCIAFYLLEHFAYMGILPV